MVPPSPFFHRGPIRDRRYFFGRERLVTRALAFLAQGQSIALVGPRRIGKTSLLLHLLDSDVQRAQLSVPAPLRCCYIDCESLGQAGADQVYGRLARCIAASQAPGQPTSADPGEPPGFARLELLAHQAAAAGAQLVLLLDEFETLAANPQLDGDFFAGLRALAMEHRLAYVTVSSRPLLELTYARVQPRSSPFFNFFALLPIGLFTRAESVHLLQELSARAGIPFTPPFCQELIAAVGDHPLFLQLIADAAFDALAAGAPQTAGLVEQLLLGPFWTEAADHWRAFWAQLAPEQQRLLALFPALAAKQPAIVRQLEAAALVARSPDGSLELSGSAWRRFVGAQPIAGLVQAPPLTLDPAQGIALIDGRPLALPPKQLDLLAYLAARRDQVVTARELCLALWGGDDAGHQESLRTAIKGIREALGPQKACLQTVRDRGYVFAGGVGAPPEPPAPPEAPGLTTGRRPSPAA